MIELFLWRLNIDSVFAETICSLRRVALIPAICDGLHETLKFRCRYFHDLYAETIDSIERGSFVTFRQRGVVKHIVNEIFYFAFECHYCLTNVNQFARAFTNNMYTQQLMRIKMKDQFQEPRLVADDLSAGNLAVLGFAHFIRNALLCQFFFVAPNGGDFRNCVNTVWKKLG